MNIQKINWKIYFKDPSQAKPDDFFRVFNTWIPDSPEIFIDVADYQHVHDGPLTLLVGHYLDYALDATDRTLGLLYSHKKSMEGSNQKKLSTSLTSLFKTAGRLESDSTFKGKVSFRTNEILLIINDRALAPNTPETYAAVKPELEKMLLPLFGPQGFTLKPLNNPKQRFSIKIQIQENHKLSDLIQTITRC